MMKGSSFNKVTIKGMKYKDQEERRGHPLDVPKITGNNWGQIQIN